MNETQFQGNYNPDPNVPLNVGLNSYNRGGAWTGQIDELRVYNTAISDKDVKGLTDYGSDIRLSESSSELDGLVAYWPFDGETEDKSANLNDGSLIFPVVSMVFAPDGRLFFSIRDAGEVRIVTQSGRVLDSPFVRLEHSSNSTTYLETHGITLDPQFVENHYVYVYATVKDIAGKIFNRIIRFTEVENKGTDQTILLDNIPNARGLEHAGALGFGPDDKLYITTDYSKQQQEDKANTNPMLSGKVLRLNRDGSIPMDNPVPNSTIYNAGHRNMFGIAFDTTTGMGIVAENDASKYDEINLLEDGQDYGYPLVQETLSSPSSSVETMIGTTETGNSSVIKPARTYYNPITPTQAIYYDGDRFPDLKGKFLIASHGEKALYAISVNNTGNIIDELAIRLPEMMGPLISIAKSPDGEIYLGGEKIYKLTSIDRNNIIPLTYFIDLSGNDLRVDNLLFNLTTKVLAINFTSENNRTGHTNDVTDTRNITSSPSLQVKIPKALLGTIYQVTSENYNTSLSDENPIEDYTTKQTRRVTNVGDTIVDIQLRSDISSDKILIKGQSSSLVKSAPRNIIR